MGLLFAQLQLERVFVAGVVAQQLFDLAQGFGVQRRGAVQRLGDARGGVVVGHVRLVSAAGQIDHATGWDFVRRAATGISRAFRATYRATGLPEASLRASPTP